VLGGITGPAQQRPTDTVTKEPPTARHTVPATVGTHEDGAELRARCCSANSAADQHPEPIQPEQLGGHGRRGSSVARPIPTSSRPSTGRQDRHNLELGPVGPRRSWQPVEYATATWPHGRRPRHGLPVAETSRHQHSEVGRRR